MRVLVFGDSLTQGYWDTKGGWVDRLREHYDTLQVQDLRQKEGPTIFNLGVSGDSSDNILGRIFAETKARTMQSAKPIVILQIGCNDSAKGAVHVTLQDYKNNLEQIVTGLENLTSKIILVGTSACDDSQTSPVFWKNVYYSNSEIEKYENTMQEVAEQQGIDFIPIFASFKSALDEGQDLLADGLHPNNEGHKLIANLVKPKLNFA